MRISAGKLKGRNILAPEGREVRPTSAKVRESIFDSLQAQVGGSRFLDLFAGSGAVGIEAFSRGASEVYFCERGRDVLPLLKQNVALLKGAGKVYEGDSFALLERLPGAFDIIFADPPYKEDCLERICAVCVRRGLLAEDGIIVYEHAAEKKVAAPEGFRIIKSKRYGSAALEYIKRGSICAVTGSFDPMTRGHVEVVRRALKMFDKAAVVIAVNDTKPSAFPLEVREKIAKKALEGFENVSVEDIVRTAQVSRGSFYTYFKNKEDLCRSIVDEHEERFFAQMEDAYSKGHSLEEVLNLLLQAHMEFFRKSPVNSKFVMQMIAYTLNRKFPAEQRRPLPEVVLGKYLAQKEGVHHLPAGAAQDISRLISALFFKVMLNAYVNTYVHGGAVPATYDEEVISRTVRIILLGVKRYYEDKKK